MLKFIELKFGLSVRKSEISSIERNIAEDGADLGSLVYLRDGRAIETPFIYMSLLMLIDSESDLEDKLNASLDRETFSHQ